MASSSSCPPAAPAPPSPALPAVVEAKQKYLAELLAELNEHDEDQSGGAVVISPTDLLRAELELLRQDDDDVDDHPHPLVQRNKALAQALLLAEEEEGQEQGDGDDQHPAEQEDTTTSNRRNSASKLYDQEIVNSYQELKSLNAVLKDRIQMEHERCDTLRETLEEYQTIHQVLVKNERDQEKSSSDTASAPPAASDDSYDDSDVQQQNKQLRDDLMYVTDRIQNERLTASKSLDGGTTNRLHDVLWKLIDGRLQQQQQANSKNDEDDTNPYVQVEDKLLLQLLRDETFVVEPYEDDSDLVCLVDYLCTSIKD